MRELHQGFWSRLFWRYGRLGYALMAPAEPLRRVVAIRRKGPAHLHLV